MKRLALSLVLALVAAVAATTVAAVRGHSAATAPAGPWYTPPELKALNAYADASFAGKEALLAGRGKVALAGPWYSPRELKALIAYSKASFAEKEAILAGRGG